MKERKNKPKSIFDTTHSMLLEIIHMFNIIVSDSFSDNSYTHMLAQSAPPPTLLSFGFKVEIKNVIFKKKSVRDHAATKLNIFYKVRKNIFFSSMYAEFYST
jgi:hypothetical protein